MVEEKNIYSIGHLRMKYLNEADNAYAMGGMENVIRCKRIIENFIGTIKDSTKVADEIKKRFDEINKVKNDMLNSLNENTKNLGYLEKKDANNERDLIEVNAIHDMKVACWIISLDNGLFYE